MIDWTKMPLMFKDTSGVIREVTKVCSVIEYKGESCRIICYLTNDRKTMNLTIVTDMTGCEVIDGGRGHIVL